MLKPVINYLLCKGIRTSAYLDDIFICSPSAFLLKSQLNFTLSLLVSLGFTPNYSNTHLIPTHEIIHLGHSWDSVRMSISLPKDKIVKTKKLASCILTNDPTFREISKLLGVLVSHATGFPFSPLYYRDLKLQFCSALKTAFSWEQSIVLKAKPLQISNVGNIVNLFFLQPSFQNYNLPSHCQLVLLIQVGEVHYHQAPGLNRSLSIISII